MAKEAAEGLQRAAILLLSLGEEQAAAVLKLMGPREVQQLGQTMTAIAGVEREQADAVLESFVLAAEKGTSIGIGAEEYVRRALIGALGEEKGAGLIDRVLHGPPSKGIEALRWMQPRAIAGLVREEHPQVIAAVLASLEPDHAGAVVDQLPEAVRGDVLLRVATLESVQPSALQALDEILAQQPQQRTGGTAAAGGVKRAAEIVNALKSSDDRKLIEEMVGIDEATTRQIQEQMFVFDNLLELDDRGIQTLLREVSSDQLVVALKGAEPQLREKIFKNMSTRAADMVRDDLETLGPVRVADVEAAQREMLTAAQRLADEGQLALGSSDDFV